MKAYLDTTTWMLTAVAGGMQPLRKMDAKRVLVLDVVLSAALPTGSNGILCLKRDKNFTGAAMALDTAWEAVSGEALTYRFTLSLNTEEIAALFTGEKETASLHADITITRPDLDTVGSQTFDVVVWRPVYQGDEQTPTPATTLVPVVQFIDDVPSAKDDFFMFEGGVAPSSGMYQTSDAQYNYTFKGGWTYWRRAAIAMWMLLAAGLLAGAAQYDMVYIQKDSAGDNQERVVTLTPSTFLSVSNNGTLQVQSAADFRAAIGLATVATSGNFSDLTGKPTTLAGYGIGGVWQTLTHGVSETTPSINNVIPSMPAALVTVDCYSSFPYNATSAAVALPSYPLVPGQIIRITAGTLASYPSALPIKIYGRNPGPDTWTNLKATLTATGQSVTLVARDAYSWTVLPPDTHATSHATGGADALTPAQIGAATAAQGSLAATALQPGWTGSGNLTTIGTLASGTVPVARISGLGSLATQNGTFSGTSSGNNTGDQDLSGYAAKAGNETISGNWNFTGNLTMNLADSVTFQRVNIGSEDYGWRYNPAGGGQVEFVFPGGAAAFYQTGTPAIPYMYFPGTVQADYLVGAIDGLTINADGLTGMVPIDVMANSLTGTLSGFLGAQSYAGANGIPYVDGGLSIGFHPSPADTRYYMTVYVVNGSGSANYLEGQYRSPVQFSADTHPSATASLDFPSIAAGGSQSLTITVSGAVTTNTPTVQLGWSAALPAGLVVSHARVSAANTVTITLTNITGSAIDPAAVTCRAAITQY